MIQANELRIGNKIYGVSDRVETVTLINDNGIVESYPGLFKEANSPQEIMYCSGIPLTEEILLKCGFEKDEDDWIHISYQQEGHTESYGIKFNGNYWEYYMFDLTRLNYLHQLQNLIFSLTGQEIDTSRLI